VFLRLKKDGLEVGERVTADTDGKYTISEVPAGAGYTIEVSLSGYTTGIISAFEVISDVTGKNLELKKLTGTLYAVKGKISISGGSASGATVRLIGSDGVTVGYGMAGTDGTYTITNVPAGNDYTIRVSLDGYATKTSDAFDVSDAVTGKDLTLTRSYTISGKITTSDGGNAAGASVQLKKDAAIVGSAVKADSNGEYIISNVPAGSYTIEVSLSGYDKKTENVTVTTNNVTKNLELTKTSSGAKTLKITGISGYTGPVTLFIAAGETEQVAWGEGTVSGSSVTISLFIYGNSSNPYTSTPWTGSGTYYVALFEKAKSQITSSDRTPDRMAQEEFSSETTTIAWGDFESGSSNEPNEDEDASKKLTLPG
jgi:hypothetical protein